MTESDDTLLKNLLAEIEQLKLADLRKYFKQLYGFEVKGFRMETLRRRIAYRLQERRLGGLSKSDAEFLDRLADEDDLANLKTPDIPYQPGTKIVPGTKFTREWHGRTYEVIYHGYREYEYDGKSFRSLTAIASHITGTHWPGTAFFGVKNND